MLSDRLGDLEANVSPHVWEAVQAQVAAQSASAAAAGTAAKWALGKWIAAAVIAGATATAAIILTPSETPVVKQESAPISAPVSTNTDTNDSNSISSDNPVESNSASVAQHSSNTADISALPEEAQNGSSSETNEMNFNSTNNTYEDGDSNNSDTSDNSGPSSKPQDSSHQGNGQEDISAQFSAIARVGSPLDYTFSAAQGRSEYAWSIDGELISTDKSFDYTFEEQGKHIIELVVTNEDGASKTSTQEVMVSVPVSMKIPTIFTPNNDGLNDEFVILVDENFEFTNIIILSDKGQVFHSHGDQFWNGLDQNGKPCDAGRYHYLIQGRDKSGQLIERSGKVTLMR